MTRLSELETPFLYVDLDVAEGNIGKMQVIANRGNKRLRPHVKTHKVPIFAQKQVDAGAVGICVQKTREAEVMAQHGIRDILISNEVIGRQKTDRIAALANFSKMSVAVDSQMGVNQLSESARQAGYEIGVYIDVDVGLERCGVRGEGAASLAKAVSKAPGLYLRGVMGYDGHTARIMKLEDRRAAVEKSWDLLNEALKAMAASGIRPETISVGGTPSSPIWSEREAVNELQPGTYIYQDAHQVELGVAEKKECALRLMTTVMSKTGDQRAVVDAGSKSFAFDTGAYPLSVDDIGGQIVKFSEEHGVVRSSEGSLKLQLGDKVSFIPAHACTAVDLWDRVYLTKGDRVLGDVAVEARGART